MKLRTKMFLIYSILAIIPMMVIGIYSYSRWKSCTSDQIRSYSSTLTDNAIEQSNRTLENINHTMDFMTYYSGDSDLTVVDILSSFSTKKKNLTPFSIYQTKKKADSILSNLMYSNNYLNGIYLVTTGGSIFGTHDERYSRINASHDCSKDRWYQTTVSLNGKYYIGTVTSDDLFIDKEPSIYLSHAVFDVYSHEFLGIILLDMNPALLNLDNITTIPDLALMYITNKTTGETLYSNVDKIDTKDKLYADNMHKQSLNLEPLELSISFDYDTLYDQYNPAGVILLAMISIFLIGEIISMYLVTKNLTFPIERLSRIMRHQRKNGFRFASPYMGRKDEIGVLYNEYAQLLETLNDSIKKNYRNRLISLDSQMKALEARINSHFLFNTLESINSMAELADNEDIATMSLALGDMFRYSIKTKSELVTLADELKHVDDYISIQTLRFGGRFRLVKDIPQELMTRSVLKLILQPLVENALYHGLNYCATGDTITISARQETSLLYISVTDNGTGMKPEVLRSIRDLLEEETAFTELGHRQGQSIGLKNIHTRIRLYYGEKYGLTVASCENAGTTITLTIPVLAGQIFHDGPVENDKEPSGLPQ